MSVVTRTRPSDAITFFISLCKSSIRGSSRYINGLTYSRTEFVKSQRAIIVSRAKSETITDKIVFPRSVTVVHRAYLRNGHMAFIDKHDEVFREIIQKRKRRFALCATVEISAVIFYTAAITYFAHHLDVVRGSL